MSDEIWTPRLILRPLELSDAETTQRLFPHWEIVQYLANKVIWPYPEDGALAYYRDWALPGVARGEEWHWGLRLKGGPDHLIGAVSLMRTGETNRGFWMGLPWQGRGLMSEAVEAVTGYWFDVLRMPVLRTSKAAANIASRRVSEKGGMRLVGTDDRDYVSGRLPTEFWEITAEEWRARVASRVQ